jgi:hypothetical protein
MSICTVNGLAYEAEAGLKTWGQLLARLERGDGPTRTVVAAVRFAGVDQPTFREAEVQVLDLRHAAPIEVELSTAAELVASAREAAIAGLDALAESARQAAEAFRLHDLPRAHRGLADFVATFQLLTTLTAAVARENTPSDQITLDSSDGEFLESLNVSLGALIDFDVNQDWISVADVLEYDIADLLPQWAAVMRDTGDGAPVIDSASGSVS